MMLSTDCGIGKSGFKKRETSGCLHRERLSDDLDVKFVQVLNVFIICMINIIQIAKRNVSFVCKNLIKPRIAEHVLIGIALNKIPVIE
jgi:hypothetical protein